MTTAPRATSAWRWVEIVRLAGKSPPGGASRAAPRLASSGPSSSTDPRSLPTSIGSGWWLDTPPHWMRSVDVPNPSIRAPRPRRISPSTSTSLIRGTFDSTHSSSVSRQAASSGSAEFLLPSTDSRPERQRPPSTFRMDMRSFRCFPGIGCAEPHDLVAQIDAELFPHLAPASLDQFGHVGGGGAAIVDDEIRVPGRHPRPPLGGPLEAGAIHERSGGGR